MPSSNAPATDVTEWLRKLESGHDQAAQQLWEVFFERLVRLANGRLKSAERRIVDAEDIALSAFASFCRGAEKQRFTQLLDRQGLWRLLVSITIHKLLHVQRDQGRLKRGGQFRQIESLGNSDNGPSAVDEILSREPTPEFAAQVAEQYELWMRALESDELTQLAKWKLEGFTNDEIATKCGRTTRTIERKLNLIRKILVHELSANCTC